MSRKLANWSGFQGRHVSPLPCESLVGSLSRNCSLLSNCIIDLAGVQEGSLFLGPEVSNLMKRNTEIFELLIVLGSS